MRSRMLVSFFLSIFLVCSYVHLCNFHFPRSIMCTGMRYICIQPEHFVTLVSLKQMLLRLRSYLEMDLWNRYDLYICIFRFNFYGRI